MDARFGSWSDLPRPLMVDLVFNHTSARHPWVKKRPEYYLTLDEPPKTSLFRPRDTPLFTKVNGRFYWSTFGPDQLDLNLYNESLRTELEEVIELYIQQGARLLRIDAAPYLFKDYHAISTPDTHAYIQSLIEQYPEVDFVVEANRGQDEIASYMRYAYAYNFSLAPLVLWALVFGEVRPLVKHLNTSHERCFNFLASHDGIGLSAAKQYVDTSRLVRYVKELGWSASGYELNINYLDALGGDVRTFLLAHALLFSLRGRPGVYYHSYFGSRGVQAASGRAVNRERLDYDSLQQELRAGGVRARVREEMDRLLAARNQYLSDAPQEAVLEGGLLVLVRGEVTCLFNFSDQEIALEEPVQDLVRGSEVRVLEPFGYAWTKKYV